MTPNAAQINDTREKIKLAMELTCQELEELIFDVYANGENEIDPHLAVIAANGITSYSLTPPDRPEQKQAYLFELGADLAREGVALLALSMVTEGWQSRDMSRASKDPQRTEILLSTGLTTDKYGSYYKQYMITRDTKNKPSFSHEPEAVGLENSFLSGIIDGYLATIDKEKIAHKSGLHFIRLNKN